MVAAKGDGHSRWESSLESFKAGARCTPEPVDALVVIANDERLSALGDQLDEPFLRQVQVLILVDQHMRIALPI